MRVTEINPASKLQLKRAELNSIERSIPEQSHDYPQQTVTVVMVAISSLKNIERTLSALLDQEDAPKFDIVVAADPNLGSLDQLTRRFPEVSFLSRVGRRTPTAGRTSRRGRTARRRSRPRGEPSPRRRLSSRPRRNMGPKGGCCTRWIAAWFCS